MSRSLSLVAGRVSPQRYMASTSANSRLQRPQGAHHAHVGFVQARFMRLHVERWVLTLWKKALCMEHKPNLSPSRAPRTWALFAISQIGRMHLAESFFRVWLETPAYTPEHRLKVRFGWCTGQLLHRTSDKTLTRYAAAFPQPESCQSHHWHSSCSSHC